MILKIYDLRKPVSPVMSFNGVTSFSVEEKCKQLRVLEVKFWGDDETDSVKVGLGETHCVFSKGEKNEVITKVQDDKDRG